MGEHAYNIQINSTKSMTGHLLGAAGVIEAIAALGAIIHGIVPPTINHFTDDEKIDSRLDFTFNKAVKKDVKVAMSNTFGFGGHKRLRFFSRKSNLLTEWSYRNTFLNSFSSKEKKVVTERDYFLSTELNKILGTEIQNINFYREAFSIKNSSKNQESNYERLEFLGDSVLGTIVSCHLFQTYPKGNEGYMTQMKSKIVNRKNLNKLGEDLKLTDLLQKNNNSVALGENISGNLFEALIGAIYLDLQYDTCKKIVLERLLTPSEINKLEKQNCEL